ncbi:MAG: hypothetical protein ABIJ92_00495 [Candidatus Aenigmatarchaeota archaeon]
MECPKCNGGAYLVDEEFIKLLENTDPLKIVVRSIFQCRACSDRFSRLTYDNLEARKREAQAAQAYYPQTEGQSQEHTQETENAPPPEGLRFF